MLPTEVIVITNQTAADVDPKKAADHLAAYLKKYIDEAKTQVKTEKDSYERVVRNNQQEGLLKVKVLAESDGKHLEVIYRDVNGRRMIPVLIEALNILGVAKVTDECQPELMKEVWTENRGGFHASQPNRYGMFNKPTAETTQPGSSANLSAPTKPGSGTRQN